MFFSKKKENAMKEKMHNATTTKETQKEEPKMKKQQNDKKAHIHNLIIVDESGSMNHLREVTLSGINETIGTIKNAQKEFAETQTHTLTLVTFDSLENLNVRYHFNNAPIENVPEFCNYHPYGNTPLYDTMGITLSKLYDSIKDDEYAVGVVTVLTDGLENASRNWRAESLRILISQLKEKGWSFSYMGSAHNVKDVADLLSIDNFMEFSHDNLGASSTWERESSSRRAYFRKMNVMYDNGFSSKDERIMHLKQYAKEYHGNRVTPENITSLNDNEVFVFGTNHNGTHNVTAMNFGAIKGQNEGIQGKCYAIPVSNDINQVLNAIANFLKYATEHPEIHFYVSNIGWDNDGCNTNIVSHTISPCIKYENVSLPACFWNELGLRTDF